MIDFGCRPADPQGNVPPGLFFCAAHLSYGYAGEVCHANSHGSVATGWPIRIATRIAGAYVYLGRPTRDPAPDAIGSLA